MITISPTHFTEIKEHGTEAYPEECCGAMLGRRDAKRAKVTEHIVRIENNWEDRPSESKHRRFAVTAEDYKALEAEAKERGLTLLGFYHTHPDHPAEPSGTDLSYAWPFFSYIILNVTNREPGQLNSFELNVDTEKFEPEEIQVS